MEGMKISDIISGLRREYNCSREYVAEHSGVSPRQIFNIESGKTPNPHRSTLQKLSNFFGVHLPRVEDGQKIWIHPEGIE